MHSEERVKEIIQEFVHDSSITPEQQAARATDLLHHVQEVADTLGNPRKRQRLSKADVARTADFAITNDCRELDHAVQMAKTRALKVVTDGFEQAKATGSAYDLEQRKRHVEALVDVFLKMASKEAVMTVKEQVSGIRGQPYDHFHVDVTADTGNLQLGPFEPHFYAYLVSDRATQGHTQATPGFHIHSLRRGPEMFKHYQDMQRIVTDPKAARLLNDTTACTNFRSVGKKSNANHKADVPAFLASYAIDARPPAFEADTLHEKFELARKDVKKLRKHQHVHVIVEQYGPGAYLLLNHETVKSITCSSYLDITNAFVGGMREFSPKLTDVIRGLEPYVSAFVEGRELPRHRLEIEVRSEDQDWASESLSELLAPSPIPRQAEADTMMETSASEFARPEEEGTISYDLAAMLTQDATDPLLFGQETGSSINWDYPQNHYTEYWNTGPEENHGMGYDEHAIDPSLR